MDHCSPMSAANPVNGHGFPGNGPGLLTSSLTLYRGWTIATICSLVLRSTSFRDRPFGVQSSIILHLRCTMIKNSASWARAIGGWTLASFCKGPFPRFGALKIWMDMAFLKSSWGGRVPWIACQNPSVYLSGIQLDVDNSFLQSVDGP